MKKSILVGLVFALCLSSVQAQDDTSVPVNDGPEEVYMEFAEKVWFPDRVATVILYTNEIVDEGAIIVEDDGDVQIVDVVYSSEEVKEGMDFKTTVLFRPKRAGLLNFPALSFESGGREYKTASKQFTASLPRKAEEMSLLMIPSKERVYVGEPVRVDVEWRCALKASSMYALNFSPDFFYDERLEVEIPRSTVSEDKQVGIPVGGRRIIAERIKSNDELGTIRFSLYVRFKEEGEKTLNPARLECASTLKSSGRFAQYKAYFNNSLFEEVETSGSYERVYTESDPMMFEVLPLPETGRSELFSGLYSPAPVTAKISQAEVEVGQLLELRLKVASEVPIGMLSLPPLARQKSLRNLFWVEDQMSQSWQEDGAEFSVRLRPLTTAITALPSLAFQVFDPESGAYETISTDALPLTVFAMDGQAYFDMRTLAGDESSLNNAGEGVWQNALLGPTGSLFGKFLKYANEYFVVWVCLSVFMYFLALPKVLERRRRSEDSNYRSCMEAYDSFRRLRSNDEEAWKAFVAMIASASGKDAPSLTVKDAVEVLGRAGSTINDIDAVIELFKQHDISRYPERKEVFSGLINAALARRVFERVSKVLVLVMCAVLFPTADLKANDWDEAVSLFTAALEEGSGTDASRDLLAEAALRFEASAEGGVYPGIAYYNAGNAWFKIGEIGRAIAAYRQSEAYLPFSEELKDNLKAARALAVDVIPESAGSGGIVQPAYLMRPLVGVLLCCALVALLYHKRYACKGSLYAFRVLSAVMMIVFLMQLWAESKVGDHAVLIADECFGRKGPSYRYDPAFAEPLHNGLESMVIEERGVWLALELADGRNCWVPASQVKRF